MILSKIYPKIFIGFTCIFLIVLYNLLYTTQRVQCITPQSCADAASIRYGKNRNGFADTQPQHRILWRLLFIR